MIVVVVILEMVAVVIPGSSRVQSVYQTTIPGQA